MKNIIIAVLVLAVVAEGYLLWKKKLMPVATVVPKQMIARPSGMPPRPPLLSKGDNLLSSTMAQYAYIIAPGDIPAASQKVLTGFSVKTTALPDGSTQVDLVPKDSDDQFQSYVLKTGQSLYFIEMTPSDDKQDEDRDLNYRDDYGIITDANGVIQ